MEKAREFRRPLYICFIDLKKAYDSVSRAALWSVLQRSYLLPHKPLSIIRALHEDSKAAVRAYGKTSDEFAVTSGVWQGCALAPTLFNLLSSIWHLDDHHSQGRGVRVVYLHDAKLVGNRRKLQLETLVTDLEYADDMALIADSWEDLKSMLKSLEVRCRDMGLTISSFLGHLSRMCENRLPNMLLVCALANGSRAAGGQKCRWNDDVTKDLKQCGLTDNWHAIAQDRSL